MIKLASWNVNSLKVRLEHVLEWLDASRADVLALQETKLLDENFPLGSFKELGFEVVFSGQKTYNGVAIISRSPIKSVTTDLPGFSDPQRRIIAATIGNLRLINLYVPNGSEVGSEKFAYKLNWLKHVSAFLKEQLAIHPNLAVVGDFNIAPQDLDVHDPAVWEGKVHVSAPERDAFQTILDLGFADSFRALHPEEQAYSWWDYRAAAFRRNLGLRIDHILLSPPLMKACKESQIDVEPRKLQRPSDHAPVWVQLST